jgi:hypothetical protein
MTNASKGSQLQAPERIWAHFEPHENPKDKIPRVFASASETGCTEYIRADVAKEYERAAYERGLVQAHEVVEVQENEYYIGKTGTVVHQIGKQIRKLVKDCNNGQAI